MPCTQRGATLPRACYRRAGRSAADDAGGCQQARNPADRRTGGRRACPLGDRDQRRCPAVSVDGDRSPAAAAVAGEPYLLLVNALLEGEPLNGGDRRAR